MSCWDSYFPCRLLKDLQDLWHSLWTHCPLRAAAQGTVIPEDLCCRLGTHCTLPAPAQGLAKPVVSSQNPIPAAQRHAGPLVLTQGPLPLPATAQGPAIPEVSIRVPVPATAQGTEGPVMSSQDTLSPAGCSGTQRTCGITSEHTAPQLPLLRVLEDLWYGLRITYLCLPLQRDLPDLWCHLGNHCQLLLGVLQNFCCCLRTHCPPAGFSGTHRTCGVDS